MGASVAEEMETSWRRSAPAAAMAHQIRNRLQGIMVEAAILRRSAAAEPNSVERIRSLANEAARELEAVGVLLPGPVLSGRCILRECLAGLEVEGAEDFDGAEAGCDANALGVLLRVLVQEALPARGFTVVRAAAANGSGGRPAVAFELTGRHEQSAPPAWVIAHQMSRDLGGSIELRDGDSPILHMHLPAPRP